MRTIAMVVGLVMATAGGASAGDRQFVLVDKARLHQQPSAKSPSVKAKGEVLLRHVARRGAWIEVQLAKSAYHCGARGYSRLGLRMFVRARDVIPVAKSAVTRRFRGGSSVTAYADVPLRTPLLRRVVPPSKRSLRFGNADRLGMAPKGRRVDMKTDAVVSIAGTRQKVSVGTQVVLLQRRKRRARIHVSRTCWSFTGWVPTSALELDEEEGVAGGVPGGVLGGLVGSSGPAPERLWLLTGSQLFWPDKRKAGVSYRTIEITTNVDRRGGLMCTMMRPGSGFPEMDVCFQPESFRRSARRPSTRPKVKPRIGAVPPPPPPPSIGTVPPPPAPRVKPRIVPQIALESQRIAGNKLIQPDVATKKQMVVDRKFRVIATFKLCVSARGTVSSVRALKTSGYRAYDKKLLRGMRGWRYRPFKVNGVAVPVCTAVTFYYRRTP